MNDVDFDANINRDVCMKSNVYIYIHISISYVLLSASFMYMMM